MVAFVNSSIGSSSKNHNINRCFSVLAMKVHLVPTIFSAPAEKVFSPGSIIIIRSLCFYNATLLLILTCWLRICIARNWSCGCQLDNMHLFDCFVTLCYIFQWWRKEWKEATGYHTSSYSRISWTNDCHSVRKLCRQMVSHC